MKKLSILLTGAMALLLCACESREDVFSHRNQTPEVMISLSPDFADSTATLEMAMRFGEQRKIYFHIADDNLQNSENPFELGYSAQIVDAIVVDAETAQKVKGDLEVALSGDMIYLTQLSDKHQRLASVVRYTVELICRDAYDVESKATILLTVSENKAPDVSLAYAPVSTNDTYSGQTYTEGWGYVLTATATDPDGDEIVAYEYLFAEDNEVTVSAAAMESNYLTTAAASGGSYIRVTTLTEVYHIFQRTGNKSVWVRAKDAFGMWSAWQKTEITISD